MRRSIFARQWGLYLLGLWCCLGGTPVSAQAQASGAAPPPEPPAVSPSAERMVEDVRRLSSPEFNGRQTGTIDDLRSALWVADRFGALGLRPAAPTPLYAGLQQPWMTVGSVNVPTIPSTVALTLITGSVVTPLQVGQDYLPLLDSPPADLSAPVTFVGYGLVDPVHGYDDYAHHDVTGHIVLILRGTPPWYEGRLSHEAKVHFARQHGAVGVLTVTGPIMSAYEARRGVGTAPLAYYGRTANKEAPSMPGAWITVSAAEQILNQTAAEAGTLAALQTDIHQRKQPRSRATQTEVRLQWDSVVSQGTLHNVIGLLDGSDPALAEETIVIGAHRDHFGRQAGLLFAGADDNASGTAVVLEVARALTAPGQRPKRSLVFVSFSGEEQGLLGSNLYVGRPARPLGKTVAMINIDHAGIGNGRLTVGVTGPDKSAAARAAETAGLSDKVDLFGYFPGGDHVPFKEAGVPTITVVSGGAHPHFHQPADTVDTVQPDTLRSVADYVLALVRQLAE